jgi:hypothetical protein
LVLLMAALDLNELWSHIESLAEQHGIKIDTSRIDRPVDAFAVPWCRAVCIPPLRSGTGYATALHELGHLLAPNQNLSELECERAAWQWARDNAKWWTPAMEHCMTQSLEQIAAKTQ